MQRYKFRGKRVDNGEWIYGSLLDKDIIVAGPVDVDEDYIGLNAWSSVDPETVGQYTGLQDKNGKEIYEGDILQDGEGHGEIEWVQEHCGYMVFTRNPSVYHRLDSDGHLNLSEVIGTRFDNPELIGEVRE